MLAALVLMTAALTPAAHAGTCDPAILGLGTYRALLVGIEDYVDNPAITDLTTPVSDVEALARLLKERYCFTDVRVLPSSKATRAGTLDALDKIGVRVLPSSKATRAGILDALDDIGADAGDKDAVLVYFAGHGMKDDARNQGYWLPRDAVRDKVSTRISNADVVDAVKAFRARHVLLISDSCFAGSLIGKKEVQAAVRVRDDGHAQRLAQKRSRWVIVSGGDEPVADAYGKSGHSVFAEGLLSVLGDNEGPYANPGGFFDKLQAFVINNAGQTPEAAPLKFEGVEGDEGGQFVFMDTGDTGDTGEPPPPPPPPPVVRDRVLARHQITMVSIPATSSDGFLMGSPTSQEGHEADETQHRVRIPRRYRLTDKEVTQALYAEVMGKNPSATRETYWAGTTHGACSDWGVGDTLPVTCVDWLDAVRFCNRLSELEGLTPAYEVSGDTVTWDRDADGYRLPTEAEWEWAARAGGRHELYAGTDDPDQLCRYGNVANPSTQKKYSWLTWEVFDCSDGYDGLARWAARAPTAGTSTT